jgi:hypothetical protein
MRRLVFVLKAWHDYRAMWPYTAKDDGRIAG